MRILEYLSRKHDTRYGLALFAATVAAGFVQLACMVGLQRILEPALFSQVSLILSLLTSYMIFSELGLQSDLVRRISASNLEHDQANVLRGVCSLRLLGAAIGCCFALATVFINDYSLFLSLCLVIILLSLFPMACLSTLESESLYTRKLGGALRVRLGKIAGTLLILLVIAALQPNGATTWPVILAFAGYTFIQGALVSFNSKARLQILVPSVSQAKEEMKSSWNLVVCRILAALSGASFINLQISLHSETGLAEFNMAQAIVAPLSLVVQIVVNLAASRLFVQSDRRLRGQQLLLLFFGVFSLHALFLLAFTTSRVINVAFPGLQHHIFVNSIVPLTISTFFALLSGYFALLFQQQQRKWASIITTIAAIIGLFLSFYWLREHAPAHSAWMTCGSQLASTLVAICLLVARKPRLQRI